MSKKYCPYERNLFLWLNDQHTAYWDAFMYLYSGKLVWLPLVIVALGVFVFKIKWKEALVLLLCATLIGILSDYVSASFIKPYFERFRPTHHPDFFGFCGNSDGYRGGRFGFISNHAANGFGVVAFTSLLFRYKYLTISLIVWATITAYSRVYLGVHFISECCGWCHLGHFDRILCLLYIFNLSPIYTESAERRSENTRIFKRKSASTYCDTLSIYRIYCNI